MTKVPTMPELDPGIADEVFWSDEITPWDEAHFVTYICWLDAEADDADWREVVRIIFGYDPEVEPNRARHSRESHLEGARWMTEWGYRHLLNGVRSR